MVIRASDKLRDGTSLLAGMSIVAVVVIAFWSATAIDANAIRNDAWRFLDLYVGGTEAGQSWLTVALKDHHFNPLYTLLYLANYRWFGLNFIWEIYFGLACAALFIAVIWRASDTPDTRALSALLALTGALIVFNPANTPVYTWSMVSQGGTYLLFYGVVLLLTFRLGTCVNQAWWRYALAILVGTAAVLAFHSLGILFYISALIVALGRLARGRRGRDGRLCLVFLVSILLASLLASWLGARGGPIQRTSVDLTDADALVALLKYMNNAFWAPFVARGVLAEPIPAALSRLGLLALVAAAVLGFWRSGTRASSVGSVGFVLIGVFVGIVLGKILIRDDPAGGIDPALAFLRRHFLLYSFGSLGMLMVLFDAARLRMTRVTSAALLIACAVFAVGVIVQVPNSLRLQQSSARFLERVACQIYLGHEVPQLLPASAGEADYSAWRERLLDERLNVFSPGHQPECGSPRDDPSRSFHPEAARRRPDPPDG